MGIAEDLLLKIANYGGAISKAVNAIPPILQRLQLQAETPGFFFQLPPVSVQMWEQHLINTWPAPAGFIGAWSIPRDHIVVESGRSIVITDFEFFAPRRRAVDNSELCDPVEFLNFGTFELQIGGRIAYNLTTIGQGPRFGGGVLLGQNQRGFKPQFTVYARGPTTVGGVFNKLVAAEPDTEPEYLGLRLCGYAIATSDLDKVLPGR